MENVYHIETHSECILYRHVYRMYIIQKCIDYVYDIEINTEC